MKIDLRQSTIDLGTSLATSPSSLLVGVTLLQHPDVSRVGQIAPLFNACAGGLARISRLEPEFRRLGEVRGEPLASPLLSRNPLFVSTTDRGTLVLDPRGSALRIRVDGRPSDRLCELSAERLEAGVLLELGDSVVLLLHTVSLAEEPEGEHGLLGDSLAIRRLRAQIRRVAADPEAIVLIRGETGSGKELAARAIHAQSSRSSKPFVAVNLGAIPASIAASALFGHERGAFSGASEKTPGFFGSAQGGTLFLDEVGETPAEVQPLLLRALREGEMQIVGSARAQRVDVRTICATDADLEAMVERRELSRALLQRIDGYPIVIPPLRERRDDIARLFFCFLTLELQKAGMSALLDRSDGMHRPWLPTRVLVALASYGWPGNIAELKMLTKRIVIDNRGLSRFELSASLQAKLGLNADTPSAVPSCVEAQRRNSSSLLDEDIVLAMRENAFKVAATAAALGVSKTWLNRRLEHCQGLRKAQHLSEREVLEAAKSCYGFDVPAMARVLEVSEHGLKLRLHDLNLR